MRIVVADDHAIVREGLVAMFRGEAHWEVVGEVSDGEAAVACVLEQRPDVAILDISMPKLNGVEAIRRIVVAAPEVKCVVLSMYGEHAIVAEALQAGCKAYVLKTSLFEEIYAAVEMVMQGGAYLSPEISGQVMEGLEYPTVMPHSILALLTGRERQIIQLLSEGMSVKEVACHLTISPKTVDATRRKAMQKLEINSMAELTKVAIREGLISI